MAFCSGDLVALWQRLGLSALVTLAAVKNAGLAAGALTFPLWWPLLQAAGRNRALRSRFRCARAASMPRLMRAAGITELPACVASQECVSGSVACALWWPQQQAAHAWHR